MSKINDLDLREIEEGIALEKIKPASLRQLVYQKIRALILTNRLRPGQNIYVAQLASDLGVSQTPVREALAMLKLDGLITLGYYKTPHVVEIDEEDIRSTYEMRILLEGWAVRYSTHSLQIDVIGQMVDLLNEVLEDVNQGQSNSYMKSDLKLHELITSEVPNPLFGRLYEIISDKSLRIRTLSEARSSEHLTKVVEEHLDIMNAIRDRNEDIAYEKLVTHLKNAMNRTLKSLSL